MDLTSVKNWEPKSDNFSNRVVSLTPGSMDFFNSKFLIAAAVTITEPETLKLNFSHRDWIDETYGNGQNKWIS